MINLSRHPIDWLIHFCGMASFIYFGCQWWVALIWGIIIEYEQKFQIWYYPLTWREYILKHSSGDLIADVLGIIFGIFIL
jgi:hypothetical protein